MLLGSGGAVVDFCCTCYEDDLGSTNREDTTGSICVRSSNGVTVLPGKTVTPLEDRTHEMHDSQKMDTSCLDFFSSQKIRQMPGAVLQDRT